MPREEKFYRLNDYQDKVTPGAELTIKHSVSFNEWYADPHITPLVGLSEQKLISMREESVAKEEGIFAKLKASTTKWDEQASQTLLLDKALEYIRTPEVAHTSNQWKQVEHGMWEISNRVYKMRYSFSQVPQSEARRVSWGIVFNVPQQPASNRYSNCWGDSLYITRQDKKLYDSLDAAQRYMQGRFDLYGHLFTELSPPVPDNHKRMFSVNGHLLPGYTLAPPERTEPDKAAVDVLLSCLEAADITPAQTAAPEPKAQVAAKVQPNQPATKPTQHTPKKSSTRKKTAPAR